MAQRGLGDPFELLGAQDAAERVVRVAQRHQPGALGHERRELGRIERPVPVGQAPDGPARRAHRAREQEVGRVRDDRLLAGRSNWRTRAARNSAEAAPSVGNRVSGSQGRPWRARRLSAAARRNSGRPSGGP